MSEATAIVPFEVEFRPEAIADLRHRLGNARWPDRQTADGWDQGVPLAYLQRLSSYWRGDYDMSRVATRLNRYPQFRTTLDGLDIHFLHVRSPHPAATPVILTHGWPGSVLEFLHVIDPLTDPIPHGRTAMDAFHLVIPSLPGFGFSDKPDTPGWNLERIGRAWSDLMLRLGYRRFGAQGGDWGGLLTTRLGIQDPEHVLGIHLNLAHASPEALLAFGELTDYEQEALAGLRRFRELEAGYFAIQSTRPQTLGYGLHDSPIGQLAWIVEKFHAWTDCDGHAESAVGRDEILDDVTLYWLTGTASSSARLYWEAGRSLYLDYRPTRVPVAYSAFPRENVRLSERWARTRYPDLRYYNRPARGGHFAALEQPELFVAEMRAGFRALSN
jgi:pimeloyl-ACP methyl ester carboxylesterase